MTDSLWSVYTTSMPELMPAAAHAGFSRSAFLDDSTALQSDDAVAPTARNAKPLRSTGIDRRGLLVDGVRPARLGVTPRTGCNESDSGLFPQASLLGRRSSARETFAALARALQAIRLASRLTRFLYANRYPLRSKTL
ncbi:hypothetical protein HAP48_0013705 [Bradyrhizobium septentrionale]|uniref:Uncharacterized protein n=1 Tax=Bradyrhizobium septentrionale TaxID=1404411 RepID=A0A973W9S6_9BRAD|nr:hypothetical protein [Bradyrhizobium septentrionale]UGY18395.1 hypothetical protein HAP48_0013705 [Bradyrhizobium septentrionale]